ncbi:Diacylglycerol kinase catalytic domain [seawater metagenome]|uniref:Diacylglycerol kinase catalytic domain n=1 Tax=seawater metagenome TaxID=1561972 RepID=A0A5E8CG49_9ZZZZ
MYKNIYILNPTSGRSKSQDIFNKVKHVVKKEELVLTTTEKDQAYKVLSKINLTNIDNIIGIGGDGTIKEIVEAVLENESKKNTLSIGHIPAGTGNGLASSILFLNHKPYNLDNSIKPITNNEKKIQEIDIACVKTEKNQYHSFLSLNVGFISDLDILTEFLRFLGSFRYYLGAVWCLIWMKTFKITLNYLLDNDEWKKIDDEFIVLWACNLSHPSFDVFISPEIKFDDGYHHILLLRKDISRWEMLMLLLNLDKGTVLNHPKALYIKTKKYEVKIKSKDAIVSIDGEKVEDMDYKIEILNKRLNILI